MPLAAGTRLGPYQIERSIGAGGMGEVYKARDTRLNRLVAIKVLPSHLATDPQSLERFEREAKSISALNHPNICALYDIGEEQPAAGETSPAIHFLVLEYLEGETLAARTAKGPMALPEILKISVEIASALDKAHRQGIIHRDLKPGNVMLTKAGSKLLDFGLARTAIARDGSASPVPFIANSQMATLTAPLTAFGAIAGTFQYMAPEQMEGEPADARSDLFAFGAVLYEMITGRRAFEGKSSARLMSSILREEPAPIASVQPMTPPALERVMRTCLTKNPDDRIQTAHDLWLSLQWIAEGGSSAGLPAPVTARRRSRDRMRWLAGALAFATISSIAAWRYKPATPAARAVTRFQYSLPEGQNLTNAGRHELAISPDGSKLVYVANKQLFLRAMDQLDAQPVRGTDEDPVEPVFSPDGQWLAYFARGERTAGTVGSWLVRKVAVGGGVPVSLGQVVASPSGASWGNGMIAFGMNAGGVAAIQSIPEFGGALRTLISTSPIKEQLAQPSWLGDGKHLVFVSAPQRGTGGGSQIVVQSPGKEDRRTLVSDGTDPRVLPTGQLLYVHSGSLLAVPFDFDRIAVTGGPVPLVEGVSESAATLAGQFALSSDGSLAFAPGTPSAAMQRMLVWIDRQGHDQPIPAKFRAYAVPRLSPDGSKIAVSSNDEEHDIWVFDLTKETLTRLTFGPALEADPVWAPGGKYLFFSSIAVPGAGSDIHGKATDGTGPIDTWTASGLGDYPRTVSPDGKWLVFERYSPNAGLWMIPLKPSGPAHALVADPNFGARHGRISPDGRWIAYDSDEARREEVFVKPFPAVDSGGWQISTDGGSDPFWSRSGRELFFRTAGNQLAMVPVQPGSAFDYGKPQPLFDISAYENMRLDISLDGTRLFAAKSSDPSAAHPSIVVVTHWLDEVKAKMPTTRQR